MSSSRLSAPGFALACLALSGPALADVVAESEAAAQVLYDSATASMDAHDYESACPKLEEVTNLVPEGVGARLTLAACYEGEGRLASAWAQYALVAPRAQRAGQLARQQKAESKMAELEPHVAQLTVEIDTKVASLDGVTITRDGIAMGKAQWGVPVPLDRGPHVIEVRAPGWVAIKREIVVENETSPTLRVGPLLPARATTAEPVTPIRAWQSPMGLGIGGVGLASASIGVILGGLAVSKAGEASNECDRTLACSTRGMVLRRDGRILADSATGLLVLGGALTATGIVLVATAPNTKAPRIRGAVGIGMLVLSGDL